MRFFPRNAQSRFDALGGSGHIGNHSQPDQAAAFDRILRYKPATTNTDVLSAYGGAK